MEDVAPFMMVVCIVFIACATGIAKKYLDYLTLRASSSQAGKVAPHGVDVNVASELRAIREELSQLRQQQANTILNLDTTLDTVSERVARLESARGVVTTPVVAPATEEPEILLAGRRAG
jgi:hypothetical protein